MYCGRELRAESANGTTPLKNHYAACKMKPLEVETSQFRLSLQPSVLGGKHGSVSNWQFDQKKIREAITKMVIIDELPFMFVEKPGFRLFMSETCPNFIVPSRKTIASDAYKLYITERAKLKSFLRNNTQTICITTDTWTSVQKLNFMCVTAHFIDDD